MPKEFKLDEIVELPIEVSFHEVNNNILFIAKNNPSWFVTSKIGAVVFNNIRKRISLREAIKNAILETSIDSKKIIEETKDLLWEIEYNDFYAGSTAYAQDTFPMHTYLTNGCNLTCTHCYRDSGVKALGELNTLEWIKIIDRYSEEVPASKISFSGGEPMSRKDFFDIVSYAKQKGHKTEVYSNGTYIKDKEIGKRLAEVADEIQISLDGLTPEINDSIRGQNSFKRTIEGINNLADSGLHVSISTVITPENENDIAENFESFTKNYLQNNNVSFRVGKIIKRGRAAKNYQDVGNQDSSMTKLIGIIDKAEVKDNFYVPRIKKGMKVTSCGFGKAFNVHYDGGVYPCPLTLPSLLLGNALETPFSELMQKLVGSADEISSEKMEECKACDLQYICAGGCRVKNLQFSGKLTNATCTQEFKQMVYKRLATVIK
ncbi:MAG TPA: radical SAM protein [Candidatus Nanoarchaeia archaeon]|nr:radical SAM protein [Candidatus Nanoarchaeia archaeon]